MHLFPEILRRKGMGQRCIRYQGLCHGIFPGGGGTPVGRVRPPHRCPYLASSCTEEWGGDGAPKIVGELQRRGIESFLVCDEGGGIITRSPSAASTAILPW